jgi:hypothetical protein
MNSAIGWTAVASEAPALAVKPELPLWRLYTLRLSYLILAGGLAAFIWPSVIVHTNEFAMAAGIRVSLLAGIGLVAAFGLRYPVRMIPLLLFELTWKVIYLIFFALPLWRAHQITNAVAENISSVSVVVIFIPLIPWGFVFRNYILKRGDRWK